MNEINELKSFYLKLSKHSNYQILSKRLYSIIGDDILVNSRYEKERLDFIFSNIDVKDKTILDVGGNTGYFSFELIDNGAKHVYYVEGNKIHADFVKLASQVLGVSPKITIINKYLNFENELNNQHYDIVLLMNILHHIGDDYGNKEITIEQAKKNIITHINYFSDKTTYLVLQIGFNWKGNIKHCLFENGTKKELINYVLNGTNKNWDILKVGIAEKQEGNIIRYNLLNEKNILRNDSIGEFLNRPIFILKSKILHGKT